MRGPRARTVARWGAVTCVAIGGLVALGWVLGVVELVSVVPGYPPLHMNAAVALLAAGAGLYGIAEAKRGWLLGGALVALAIGGLTLIEYMAGVELRIDRLLLSDPSRFEIRPEYSGRMAASTALALILVGAAYQ